MPGVPPLDAFFTPIEELECIYYDLSGGRVYGQDGDIVDCLAEKQINSFSELLVQLDGFVTDLVVGGAVREAFVTGTAAEEGFNPFACWFGCPVCMHGVSTPFTAREPYPHNFSFPSICTEIRFEPWTHRKVV